jgi:2-oxo-3-hexenedioate decarboxylase
MMAADSGETRAWRSARLLDKARREGQPTPQWRGDQALTLIEGFQAQAHGIALREQAGDTLVGFKLAFTNASMQARLGLAGPMLGLLTRSMALVDGAVLPRALLNHPRAEPEIAFRMAGPVSADATDADLLAAIDAVAPAIEIIDSRYRDFQFALPDMVADNISSCAFATGKWLPPGRELGGLAVALRLDDVVVATGRSDAILGHPLLALRAVLRLAQEAGREVQQGAVVMAGSATDPVVLPAGARCGSRWKGWGRCRWADRPRSAHAGVCGAGGVQSVHPGV